jgi:DnaJ family protein B protein 4
LEELFTGITKKMKIKRSTIMSGESTSNNNNNTSNTRPPEIILNLEIPPGTLNGTKITFPSTGSEVAPGVYQDVQFIIRELPHKIFKRSGTNLFALCNISLLDALLATPISFTHLDGKDIILTVESPEIVIHPGFILAVQGQGMPVPPTRAGVSLLEAGMRGNLHVEFNIVFPKVLSEEIKMKLKEVLGGGNNNSKI